MEKIITAGLVVMAVYTLYAIFTGNILVVV